MGLVLFEVMAGGAMSFLELIEYTAVHRLLVANELVKKWPWPSKADGWTGILRIAL
jgi:hypothetical protein